MSLKRLLFLFAIAAVCAGFLRLLVFEGIYVATGSMEPTLPVGTHAVLDKLTYRFRSPRRGDIVVFQAPVPPDEEMIKRVIAVPGDTVEIRRKQVLIDGEALTEDYAQHTRAGERLKGDDLGPLEVPSMHLFVLGDNRDESNDSSMWKDEKGERVYFVPMSRVRGVLRGFY